MIHEAIESMASVELKSHKVNVHINYYLVFVCLIESHLGICMDYKYRLKYKFCFFFFWLFFLFQKDQIDHLFECLFHLARIPGSDTAKYLSTETACAFKKEHTKPKHWPSLLLIL